MILFSHMSKFVKIHQLNITKITKTGYKKRLVKIIEVFPKKEMKNSESTRVKDIKTSLQMKNKGWLGIEKIIARRGKTFIS